MKGSKRGFSLVDLVALAVVVSLVASVGIPSLFRAQELSRRMVCAANLKGIGAAAKNYATDNDGQWMIPGFAESLIDNGGIEYFPESLNLHPRVGEVGYIRFVQSESDDKIGVGGSSAVTTTRAFWMLVRSGAAPVQQFICPSALNDAVDGTENIQMYYDFERYSSISYGYQVPFGPADTQPREGADPRRIHAADKGPFYFITNAPNWETGPNDQFVRLDDSPHYWRTGNSPNHGGHRNGEGQNVLFADGSVSFSRIPAVGADGDNIYTVMDGDWDAPEGFNRIHGQAPQTASNQFPYPGQDAFLLDSTTFSSTDTLVFP